MKDLVILGEKDLKVTSVTPLKNNKYKVSFDLADDVLVNEDELVKYRLVKGKELDNETYNLIIRDNILYEAYNKALVYSSNYIKCLKLKINTESKIFFLENYRYDYECLKFCGNK